MPGKTDWGRYALSFKASRSRSPEWLQRWMERVEQVAGRAPADLPARPWLDAGAGACRFGPVLAAYWQRPVVALDANEPMLRQAEPDARVHRVVGDILAPPCPPAAFAGIWVHLVLNQVREWRAAVRTLGACVAPGGVLAILTYARPGGPMPLTRELFPELGPLTADHWPAPDNIAAVMGDCAAEVCTGEFKDARTFPAEGYKLAIEAKAFSSLDLLTDEQFAAGVARMHGRFPDGAPPIEHVDHTRLIVGRWSAR